MKKFIILPALLAFLGLQVSCTSDAEKKEQRQEAQEKVEEAQESGEDVEIDRDVFGDDEIELE